MITWLTTQLFQLMFGTKISGFDMEFIKFLGFTELLIEVTAVLILIVAGIHFWIESKEQSNAS